MLDERGVIGMKDYFYIFMDRRLAARSCTVNKPDCQGGANLEGTGDSDPAVLLVIRVRRRGGALLPRLYAYIMAETTRQQIWTI
jgi:hypothetical protein